MTLFNEENNLIDANSLPIFLTKSQIERGGPTLLWMLLTLLAAFITFITLMALYKRSPQNVINDRINAESFVKNVGEMLLVDESKRTL